MDKNQCVNEATDLIKATVTRIVDKVRQNLTGLINDNARPLLAKFNTIIQQRLTETSQVWASSNSANVIPVLPDNCKYYTKVSDLVVVTFEYKPQVRSLLMCYALVKNIFVKDHSAGKDYETGKPIALSLPYVILTLVFEKNRFIGLWINYRNKPLNNLHDMLYLANLPNVRADDNKVCLGQIFQDDTIKEMAKLSIAVQCDRVISAFWQSLFNLDYPDYFQAIAHKTPKMATLLDWHRSTITDPLFILKVDWKECETLGMLVNRLTHKNGTDNTLNVIIQCETEHALKGLTDSIQDLVRQSVASLDSEWLIATCVAEKLTEVLKEAMAADAKILREVEAERLEAWTKQKMEIERKMEINAINLSRFTDDDDPYNNPSPWKKSW